MAAPATPTNLWVAGSPKLGSPVYCSCSCDDAETITYTLREAAGDPVLFTVTSSQRAAAGYGAWYYWLPTDQLVNGTGYVEVYATNSDGTSGTASFAFTVHLPPAVTVTAPAGGATISSLPMTVSWTASSDDGLSVLFVAIADGDGNLAYGSNPATWETSVSIGSDEIVLSDGVVYTVTVGARSGYGMDGSDAASFTVSWPKPAKPTVTAVQDGLSVDLTVRKGAGGAAATDHLALMRYDASRDEWATIADGLADGGSATDVLPPLGVPVTYRAIAVSAIGASTASDDLVLTVDTASWAFSFKDGGALSTIALAYNPQASYSMGHGGDMYHLADGGAGGGLPVWYGTTDRDESGTLKFDTVMNGDADALRSAVMAHPVMWLRDPFGHRWRAHVELSYTHGVGQVWPVTLSWDAVRFEEA